MHEIMVEDVINLTGIKILKANGKEIKALCPFCNDTKGHLYINHVRGVYKCHRCGEEGNALTLYAKINKISTKEAFKILISSERITNSKVLYSKNIINDDENEADIEIRDKTYNALLDLLTLSRTHYENLINRGLSIENIKEKKYKSLEIDYFRRRDICQILIKSGYQLDGVPGFYVDKDGYWNFYSNENTGILIPSRNIKGQIQSMQVRLDNVENNKYRNFTSSGKYRGTKAKNYIHIAFKGTKKIVITEGILKADVAAELSNTTFIGVVGVNSYKGVIEVLKELEAQEIVIAYDMDKYTNENVLKAEEKLIFLIRNELKRDVKVAEWKREYKGIDDYLLYIRKKKIREN